MSQQGPLPFLQFCGVEIANAARTVEYLRLGLGNTSSGRWELGDGDLCSVLYRVNAVAYPDAVLADDPAVYLRLGEIFGVVARDETQNNNDGDYVNSPTLGVAGALDDSNTAVRLNGVDQYVQVTDAATLDNGDVVTFECWVKLAALPGAGTSYTLAGKGTGAWHVTVEDTGAVAVFKAGTAEIVRSTVSLTVGAWAHVVVTKNGATVRIYIDGADRTGTVTNQTCVSTATDLFIGRHPTLVTNFLNADLDEVAVYPTALSSARVAAHWEAGRNLCLFPFTYVSPSSDPAPWYDPNEPGAATFLGLIMLDLKGYDSVITRKVAERAGGLGGGVLAGQRRLPRVWRFRAALVSADDAGAEYGLRWLTSILEASDCDQCETCDLTVRLVCPPDDCSDDTLGEWVSYDAALTSGPTEVEPRAPGSPADTLAGCRDVVVVEWTMTAANPYLYQRAQDCLSAPVVIGADNPDCENVYAAPGGFYPGAVYVSGDLQPPATGPGDPVCCEVEPPARGTLGAVFTFDSAGGMGSVLMEAHVQCPASDDDDPVLQMQLAGIPMDSVVVVDSARHEVTVTTTTGSGDPVTSDGLYLVTLPVGRGLEWIEVRDCDDLHCVCARPADACAGGADTTVQIATQVREG